MPHGPVSDGSLKDQILQATCDRVAAAPEFPPEVAKMVSQIAERGELARPEQVLRALSYDSQAVPHETP